MEFTNSFVLEAISREFPESVLDSSEPYGMLTIEIKKEDLKKVVHPVSYTHLDVYKRQAYISALQLNSLNLQLEKIMQ